MSRRTDFVRDDDSKETWRLAGDRIQVLVRGDHTSKWKQLLKEDMTCIINNGNVYDNDFQWKLCDHPKKIVFLSGTTVKPVDLNNIPSEKYFFKDFSDILTGECKMDRLQDIIGVVDEIENCQSKTGGKKIVISFKLKDLRGNIVTCTLWDTYGTRFLNYYNDESNHGAIVIVLTHAIIKDSQVSNGWSGSKLFINDDIGVIKEFMSKLSESQRNEKPSQSTQTISSWSGSIQYTSIDKFVYNAKCMLLTEVAKLKQDIAPNPDNPFKCGCGENVVKPVPRYKVEIHVIDGDSKFRFVFWDIDCFNIIGKTADDMRKSMIENGEDDPMVYPDELEVLLKKRMAFRVKVQPNFNKGSVQKLLTDASSVDQILENYIKQQDEQTTDIEVKEPNTPIDTLTFNISGKDPRKEDNVDFSAHSLSACGENDPEINSIVTPTKAKSSSAPDGDNECELVGAT
ncbi:uncharacterized protein LOC131658086 [Vicia villosa]|uniref:uncharacterized protein LOC131658086 n=1 Tax=Vicia villosa TaxID=3911 RepID=UPI00273C872A|nr:uncharacterized protein LOC131658086 [Vicia villosa]